MDPAATLRSLRPSRATAVLAVSAALLVPGLPAAAWTGPISHPAPPSTFGPPPSLQVTPDGTALLLGQDPDQPAAERARLVRLGTNGRATAAPAFPATFGENKETWNDNVIVSEPDAAGAVLVYQRNTKKYLHLAKGQNPATATVRTTPDRITHLDTNAAGAAAAIVGGGSTVSVYRRAAGAAASWVKVPTTAANNELDRIGQDRSYGVGITIDPNGGIFVVYETEQESALLQAYAPPGGSFGGPSLIGSPTEEIDHDALAYAHSTNGHVALGWHVHRTVAPNVPDRVMVAVRRPGATKLGTASVLAKEPSGSGARVVLLTALGITDSARVYAGQRDAQRVSGCTYNIHGTSTEYLATSMLGSSWSKLALPGAGTWTQSTSLAGIATAGNHVRIATVEARTTGARCTANLPTSQSLSVRTPSAATFGTPRVLIPLTRINPASNNIPISVPGLAVGTGGHAAMVVARPINNQRAHVLFVDGAAAAPKPKAGTVSVAKNQKLKKKKVKATVSCVKAGASPKAKCTAKVAVRVKQGKKFKAAGKTTVKVTAGKKKAIKVTLNKKARKRITGTAKKTKLRFVVTVTKKGARTVKVTRTKNVRP